ncbi:neurofilament heavy polypeptide-like [Ruditapes philippinarum]|uniref:neurofilament heavy polypeptide-like n=1 Tax=Ruditapes philippinarum TaxID=129788 RepID=UPI00295B75B2|nr:neurofilament heavy polypeptide-like [Ruditapes philippinarum]
MSIREKVGGGREEGYAVAKTEDVENLAKKDELTEEVKAAEEGELALAETQDEKKEPLLSEEQKVDTVDEGKPEEKKEFEPEEKETANTDQAKIESPKTEQAPTEPAKQEDIPAADDQPSSEKADKPQE